MTTERSQAVEMIRDCRIVAIIRTSSAAEAVERGELLVAAGLPVNRGGSNDTSRA
jgi:2-keto-3-deoxy-6-phosphogluconate aldolase